MVWVVVTDYRSIEGTSLSSCCNFAVNPHFFTSLYFFCRLLIFDALFLMALLLHQFNFHCSYRAQINMCCMLLMDTGITMFGLWITCQLIADNMHNCGIFDHFLLFAQFLQFLDVFLLLLHVVCLLLVLTLLVVFPYLVFY